MKPTNDDISRAIHAPHHNRPPRPADPDMSFGRIEAILRNLLTTGDHKLDNYIYMAIRRAQMCQKGGKR